MTGLGFGRLMTCSRWMQSRVERKWLLEFEGIGGRRGAREKDEVPAMRRDRARDRDESMASKQIIPIGLLSRAGNARACPVGIGHVFRIDDIDIASVGDGCGRHCMRHSVQRPKTLVNRDLKDRRRRVE